MEALRRRDGRVLCIGHRGAPALARENTIASFRAAVACGVDLVEFDVSALADGALVVAHSADLAEIAHGRASAGGTARTLDDVRRVAPDVPTLDETLAFFAAEATGVGVHLDLKAHADAALVASRVAAHGLVARTVVSSTHARALGVVAAEAPGLAVGLTYPHDRRGISRRPRMAPLVAVGLRAVRSSAAIRVPHLADAAGASAVFLHHRVVTPTAVRRLHARRLAVVAWTVDEPVEVVRAVAAGVDGLISNDPEMLLATLTT